MTVSIVELYKRMGVDADKYTLVPVTSNLDGNYRAEAVVDMGLMNLLMGYYQAEVRQALHQINEDTDRPEDKGWARVADSYAFMDSGDEASVEAMTYALIIAREKGYIEVETWDGYLYFKPTAKCFHMELYTYRNTIG